MLRYFSGMLLTTICIFLVGITACQATPQQQQQRLDDLHASTRKYAADLLLTPMAVVCRGHLEGQWARCDLRTREAGVLPLKCYQGVCRLLD